MTEETGKKRVLVYLKILFWYSPRKIEESEENIQASAGRLWRVNVTRR
jgi:hypothetical protein